MSQFPSEFLWGGAIAANQYEGAYLEGGRGLSNVDFIPAGKNRFSVACGDVDPRVLKDERYPSRYAVDGYHHCLEDIRMFAQMGIKVFRFSICWSRIFPNGDDHEVNEEGLRFYESMIDECLKYHIEPLITINHLMFHYILLKNMVRREIERWLSFIFNFVALYLQDLREK